MCTYVRFLTCSSSVHVDTTVERDGIVLVLYVVYTVCTTRHTAEHTFGWRSPKKYIVCASPLYRIVCHTVDGRYWTHTHQQQNQRNQQQIFHLNINIKFISSSFFFSCSFRWCRIHSLVSRAWIRILDAPHLWPTLLLKHMHWSHHRIQSSVSIAAWFWAKFWIFPKLHTIFHSYLSIVTLIADALVSVCVEKAVEQWLKENWSIIFSSSPSPFVEYIRYYGIDDSNNSSNNHNNHVYNMRVVFGHFASLSVCRCRCLWS